MNREHLIGRLLAATPDQLVAVTQALDDKPASPVSIRMLDFRQTAEALNVSRQTVRRMVADGRLPRVETRAGRFRVPEAALIGLIAQSLQPKGENTSRLNDQWR